MMVFREAAWSCRAWWVWCMALWLAFSIAPLRTGAAEQPVPAAHSPGWVVISIADYRELRAQAYPGEPTPDVAPLAACLTRVEYDLRIDGELASGKAALTVDVLKEGWVRIPIPAGLLVREARLDGKPLSLVFGGDREGHQLTALLSRPGRSVLSLEIAFPVTSNAGKESLSLPAADSGITRAVVQLPKQGVEVTVSGGMMAETSEVSASSRWVAYGTGGQSLVFVWQHRAEDHRGIQPLRLRGSVVQLVTLGEDADAISAEVQFEVAQGLAREVRLLLPQSVTVNQVQGPMVADWEMKKGELAVSFLEPVEHGTHFALSGEVRLPREGTIDVPLMRLQKAERETGGVAVEVLGAGEIKDVKTHGLDEADGSELGELVAARQSPALAAFRFRTGDPAARALQVQVARYAQQAVLLANVEEARYRVLFSQDGKSLLQARYAIRNNQRNFVKVTLPSGSSLWSAALAGRPVKPGQAADGSLLLPLEKARGGEEAPAFALELVYFSRTPKWDEKGEAKLLLPTLDLPISRTGLLLYYPPSYEVAAEPGSFRVETYADPFSPALKPGQAETAAAPAASVSSSRPAERKDEVATQRLLDSFRSRTAGGRAAGVLPIRVLFPAFGPSLFLVSELASANQTASMSFSYRHDRKAGAR